MTEKNKEIHLLGILREARSVHKQRLQPFLREQELTEDQWRVLRALTKNPTAGLDAKSIAQQTRMVAPSVTGVLGRMERDGLITRTKSESDGRFAVIKPTQLGLDKSNHVAEVVQRYYLSIEKNLGKEKMQLLFELLSELIELGKNPSLATANFNESK